MNYGEKADSVLYALYWGFLLTDLCYQLHITPTNENKKDLHEKSKEALGYKSIAGLDNEGMRKYLFLFLCEWAVEKGIFIRTSDKMPIGIENYNLSEIWSLL